MTYKEKIMRRKVAKPVKLAEEIPEKVVDPTIPSPADPAVESQPEKNATEKSKEPPSKWFTGEW